MTGWMIYSKKDIEKNIGFVEMFREHFGKYDVNIKLIVLEEILEKISDFGTDVLPDFVINRSRDYKISQVLEKKGIQVFNNSKVTKIANDKAETYGYLKEVVPFMPVLCDEKKIVSKKLQENADFEYPYVIKSSSGHGGSQVFMVENQQQEKAALQSIAGQKYIVQKVCTDLGKDVRVYILGNEIVAAVLRTSQQSFKSNFSLGGRAETYVLNEQEKEMVHAITEALPMDYAGIDFTFHHGKAVFNEIEDAVGARMLYCTSEIDIVKDVAEYIINKMKGTH